MDHKSRPRSRAMPVKPDKGRKLDAILLKITETSKSDIGDEKLGISPENLSVEAFDETSTAVGYEELSPPDGSLDLLQRKKTTRKGDVRRVMRPLGGSPTPLDEHDVEERVNGHNDNFEDKDDDMADENSRSSLQAQEEHKAINTVGGVNTIGERLSLLDAYLYNEESDEYEGPQQSSENGIDSMAHDSLGSENFDMDDDEFMVNGAVTVMPVDPEPTDVAIDKAQRHEKVKGTPQPPTCNICGKSFSCISNVYRHKRKVHRKKGSKVTSGVTQSAMAASASPVSPQTLGTTTASSATSVSTNSQVADANHTEKKTDKLASPANGTIQTSHNLGREINCELCGKTLTKSNIARHRRLVHFNPNRRQTAKPVVKEEKKDPKVASDNKESQSTKGRKDAKEPSQRDNPAPPKLTTCVVGKKIKFSCDICHQAFSCRSNVYRHKRLVHKKSTKDSIHVSKVSVISGSNKSTDRNMKKEIDSDKKKDVKKEKGSKIRVKPESGNGELSFPLDTPANSMVSLPSYRRAKYECSICGLVFMARSTYYRHKKTHRTGGLTTSSNAVSNEATKEETGKKATVEKPSAGNDKNLKPEKKKTQDEASQDTVRVSTSSRTDLTIITSGRGKSKFACGICGQVFPCRSNAYHHRRLAHGKHGNASKGVKASTPRPETPESQTPDNLRWSRRPGSCDICGKIFSCKGNIYRHKRLVHGVDSGGRAMFEGGCEKQPPLSPPSPPSPPSPLPSNDKVDAGKYLCDICGNGFSCAGNVQRHKRNVHGMTPTKEAYMSNSRAKKLVAKAKSYSTRRANAHGQSHDLRSGALPMRNLTRKQENEKSKFEEKQEEEKTIADEIVLNVENVQNQSDVIQNEKMVFDTQDTELDQNPAESNSKILEIAPDIDDASDEKEATLSDEQPAMASEKEEEKEENTSMEIPTVEVPVEEMKCQQCGEIFNDHIDFTKHLEDHRTQANKGRSVSLELLPQPQQLTASKQNSVSEFRYVGHPFPSSPGYYPYHQYNSPNFYRSYNGCCDSACQASHFDPHIQREHEKQPVFYGPHPYYSHPVQQPALHHPDQIYGFGTPGRFEDPQKRLGHHHQEPCFNDAYNPGYRHYPKSNCSPDPRFLETSHGCEMSCSEELHSSDHNQVLHDIINANLVEESLVSNVYSCLSCPKAFNTRVDLDQHTEKHSSEPLTDFTEYCPPPEFASPSSARPHFHYPRPGFCSQGSEVYPHAINHRVPHIPQQPPLSHLPHNIPHGPSFISPRFELSPVSCQVQPTMISQNFQGSGTDEQHDDEPMVNRVVSCCYCSAKCSTKTELWSHLMRRHGLKSRDARSKVNDCVRLKIKLWSPKKPRCSVPQKMNTQMVIDEDRVLKKQSDLPRENGGTVVESLNIPLDKNTEAKDLSVKVVGTEAILIPQNKQVIEEKAETVSPAVEIMKDKADYLYRNKGDNESSKNEVSAEVAYTSDTVSEQEGNLFHSVCENVMALINSPDNNNKQTEFDFLNAGCGTFNIKNRSLRCRNCLFVSSSEKCLRLHSRLHRGELPFECVMCFKRFRNILVLKQHKELHSPHATKVLHCKVCERKFTSLINYKRHIFYHEDKVAVTCETCGRTFLSQTAYKQHRELQLCTAIGGVFTCNICRIKVKSRKHLLTHINKKHDREMYLYCSYCCRCFRDRLKLKRHAQTHIHGNSHGRITRKRSSVSKADLQDHNAANLKCICVVCQLSFTSHKMLERHRLFCHSNLRRTWLKKIKQKKCRVPTVGDHTKMLKDIYCRICGKTFTSKVKLKEHSILHNGVVGSRPMEAVVES